MHVSLTPWLEGSVLDDETAIVIGVVISSSERDQYVTSAAVDG